MKILNFDHKIHPSTRKMDYGFDLPSNHIFRTHTQRKRERRPLITHAKSKPSKERVLRRPIPHPHRPIPYPHRPIPLCRPIFINPSLILIDPSASILFPQRPTSFLFPQDLGFYGVHIVCFYFVYMIWLR